MAAFFACAITIQPLPRRDAHPGSKLVLAWCAGFESAVGTFAFRQGMATMQVSCFVPAARISNFQDRKLQTLKEKRQTLTQNLAQLLSLES